MEINFSRNDIIELNCKYSCSTGISKNLRVVRNLILSSFGCLVFIASLYIFLAKIFNMAIDNFSQEQEEVLWEVVHSSLPENDDTDENNYYYALYTDYIQELLENLPLSIYPQKYSKVNIYIANDHSVNAFAAPGGRVILTKGLLNNIKSENGLMFVIGHEIGHLNRGDHIKEFSRSLAAAVICVASFSADFNMSDLILMFDNHFTKEAESEADIWGLRTILTMYGHAGGFDEFFNILLELGILNEETESFSTHPATYKRIDAINTLIAKHQIPQLSTISLQ